LPRPFLLKYCILWLNPLVVCLPCISFPLNFNSNALLSILHFPILSIPFTRPNLCCCFYSNPVEMFPHIYFHTFPPALLKILHALLSFYFVSLKKSPCFSIKL
jgi:hypothetical protein